MSTQVSKYSTLSIPPSLRAVGLVTGSIGVLEIVPRKSSHENSKVVFNNCFHRLDGLEPVRLCGS